MFFHMYWSWFGWTEPEPEPPEHFTRSRSRPKCGWLRIPGFNVDRHEVSRVHKMIAHLNQLFSYETNFSCTYNIVYLYLHYKDAGIGDSMLLVWTFLFKLSGISILLPSDRYWMKTNRSWSLECWLQSICPFGYNYFLRSPKQFRFLRRCSTTTICMLRCTLSITTGECFETTV